MVDTWLSIASPLAALAAIIIATISWRDDRRGNRLAQHYELINAADCMIGHDETLLRFRGIDARTIEADYGVTANELSYLLQVFNAGSVSHRTRAEGRRAGGPFPEGDYWYDLLASEPTQRAFPLLRRLFDAKNPFMATCETTMRSMVR